MFDNKSDYALNKKDQDSMLISEQISGSAVSKSDTMRWRSFLPAHSCDFDGSQP